MFTGLMLASTVSVGAGLHGHYYDYDYDYDYDDVTFTWHKCSRVDASIAFT